MSAARSRSRRSSPSPRLPAWSSIPAASPGHSLFFAFPGSRADGRQFAADALARGAVAVVSESPAPPELAAAVDPGGARPQALALAARNFYGRPDERLVLTGITGTNGKTTTSYLVDSVLRAAGKTTALIGTIEYHLAGRVLPAVNTTPESLDLMRLFAELEKAGGTPRDHGGLLPRAGAGPRLRPALPHRDLHQSDPRPSGFPRRHGNVLRRQAAAFRRRGRRRRRSSPCSIATTSRARRIKRASQDRSLWYGLGPGCRPARAPHLLRLSAACASTCSTASSAFPWNRR